MDIRELLAFAVAHKASDLHVSADLPPMIRVDGDLRRVDLPPLAHSEVCAMIYDLMNEGQRNEFETFLEVDFSFEIANLSRFRVNAFRQARGAAAVFRIISALIPGMNDLGLPPVCDEIINYAQGLVLITGPTGSGKSTTLAAMIECINATRYGHILTIEDPIEFVYQSNKCLVNQREVKRDTLHFNTALRSALREDPDVILVGELRDLETIRLAMTAAETGHLVFATLHTNSAPKAINRIIDVFPAPEKAMVRSLLAESLKAVLAQTLLKKNGGGRVAAFEIMRCTAAIRHLIREDKIAQMYSAIQTGQAQGMQTLDQHLALLVQKNILSRSTACEAALDKTLF